MKDQFPYVSKELLCVDGDYLQDFYFSVGHFAPILFFVFLPDPGAVKALPLGGSWLDPNFRTWSYSATFLHYIILISLCCILNKKPQDYPNKSEPIVVSHASRVQAG